MTAVTTDTLGDTLIPVINKLQDIFSQVTLDFTLNLPQVAVVGSQSSGKSSVLEALVGRDFLPRGPEICTRRPLLLKLIKTSAPAPGGAAEWGEFRHSPGKMYTDFERIRQEIMNETERVAGSNKGISDKPICLTVYSPNVLTMTLVDLPGITKVPVGDQPADIERQIRDMVYEHIRNPACIILAVSPANVDLANSDSLQMAQTVDPQGSRTIGVVTKLDIMDRGTNGVDMLAGRTVPLKLGYVGVVLRSQADVMQKRSMADARAAEAVFFAAHPEYQEVASQCGVRNLARRLNAILVDHIAALLPGLRRRLETALDTRQQELQIYGEAPPSTSAAARGALLLGLLSEYTDRFSAMLQGRSEELPTNELAGGARIRHVFQEVFVKGVRDLNPGRELTDDDIRTAIKNSSGVSGSLLIPQEPFEILVRRAITRLLPPALHCKGLVHDELLRISMQACPKDLSRFPVLERRLGEAVGEFILKGAQPAERMIRDLVSCEHNYINTDHPEFIGGSKAVKEVMEGVQLRKAAAKAKEEAALLNKDKNPKPQGASEPTPNPSTSAPDANGPTSAAANRLGLKSLQEPSSYASSDIIKRSPVAGSLLPPSGGSDPLDGPSTSEGGPAPGHSWFSWFTRADSKGHDPRNGDDPSAHVPGARLQATKPKNEQEQLEVEIIRLLVASYFNIVRKTLQDLVPKAIMHFLVHHSQKGLHQHLITCLYKEELFEDLMKERDDVVAKRQSCLEVLGALKAALRAIDEIHLPASLLPSSSAAFSSPRGPSRLRHGFSPADRHPSMNVAAQLAHVAAASLSPTELPAYNL